MTKRPFMRAGHLCDIEKDDKDASKPVAQHYTIP